MRREKETPNTYKDVRIVKFLDSHWNYSCVLKMNFIKMMNRFIIPNNEQPVRSAHIPNVPPRLAILSDNVILASRTQLSFLSRGSCTSNSLLSNYYQWLQPFEICWFCYPSPYRTMYKLEPRKVQNSWIRVLRYKHEMVDICVVARNIQDWFTFLSDNGGQMGLFSKKKKKKPLSIVIS